MGGGEELEYPCFCKPKIGYGSRGVKKIDNRGQLIEHLEKNPRSLVLEYLSGNEYTVDCFTDKYGKLLFYGARERRRIQNGISVNTLPIHDNGEFKEIVERINEKLSFRGAWFVQLKRNGEGELVLLEIASRFAGSSGLYRARGINFAQLTLFDAMGYDVSIIDNKFDVEMDRALDGVFKINIEYDELFIDYDDTIILHGEKYNEEAMRLLYKMKNQGVRITLLTSHEGNLEESLRENRLYGMFDRVIHISKEENKADFIDNRNAIFIDDSFAERKRVLEQTGIPVFGVDMIGSL